jgi:nucleoside-diphosphate-sugar epimerase
MRVFVTGATGVLGRRAVPLMLEAGHEVTAVGRSPEKRAQLERLGARAINLDLFDPEAVRRAVRGAEAICNLATAVPKTEIGTFLPWSWHGMDRIRHQVSEANTGRFTRSGGAGVVLRFGFLYGPGDGMTLKLIEGVRRGWFALFGQPDGFCSWSEHGDTARAVVAALGVPAGVYNVVEDEPMRRRELASGLARALSVRPPRLLPRWATPLGGVVGETIGRSLRISNEKLRRAGGWSPRYRTALEGFEAVIEQGEREEEERARELAS